jgi:thioredoxin 1
MGSKQSILRLGAAVAIVGIAIAVYLVRPASEATPAGGEATPTGEAVATNALPRLLDLGADRCVPCKMMAPILEELKVEYASVFTVEFLDVWKNPEAAEPYKLKVIPTQIFFDSQGTELFRHEGYYGREDILAKWHELGVEWAEEGT